MMYGEGIQQWKEYVRWFGYGPTKEVFLEGVRFTRDIFSEAPWYVRFTINVMAVIAFGELQVIRFLHWCATRR